MYRSLIFLFSLSIFPLSAQHYVVESNKPVSKKLYDNNVIQNKKSLKTNYAHYIQSYNSSLINEIHRRVRLYDYQRGKSCTVSFDHDVVNGELLNLQVFYCTMGKEFEQELPIVVAQAISAVRPVRGNLIQAAVRSQYFKFIPRFEGTSRNEKPSSFSKTYTTPQNK